MEGGRDLYIYIVYKYIFEASIMIHRKSCVMATAGFAFASHCHPAWSFFRLPVGLVRHPSPPPMSILPLRSCTITRSFTQYCDDICRGSQTATSFVHDRCYFSQRKHQWTRLFGSKSGSGIPGAILVRDEQKALLNIDLNRLQKTATEIRKYLASSSSGNDYETYDVSIYLVDDEAMREANHESRKIDQPTDILSFQFHDAIKPGKLNDPMVDAADYYNLGDILIDVPYVIRSCQEDQRNWEDGMSSEASAENNDGLEEDEEEEEEVWDDRGISGAMSKIFDPELRINMLLIHGMLHLVGYDHIDDADYELMVKKEEEILETLQRNGALQLPTSVGDNK